MPKPYLIIITGKAGSGKTTLAKNISNDFYMPLISRDQIKEGYVHTLGRKHSELPKEANKTATDIFFDTLKLLLINNVSVIAEAAFQHGVWASKLEQFKDNARIYFLICKLEDKVAFDRYVKRGLDNTFREYFHGDKSVEIIKKGNKAETDIYEEPRLDVPIYYINTLNEYNPSIQELKKSILNLTNYKFSRHSRTTASTCIVCGNISTGWIFFNPYAFLQSNFKSRANVAGSHDI